MLLLTPALLAQPVGSPAATPSGAKITPAQTPPLSPAGTLPPGQPVPTQGAPLTPGTERPDAQPRTPAGSNVQPSDPGPARAPATAPEPQPSPAPPATEPVVSPGVKPNETLNPQGLPETKSEQPGGGAVQTTVPSGPAVAPGTLPLTLPDAALVALRNNPQLKLSEAQIESAQAAIRSASAPFFPSLTGNINYSNSEAQSQAAGGGQNQIVTGGVRNYSSGVTASQTLTDFGRTISAVDAADETKLATQWQKSDAVQTLLLSVAENYFAVLRNHEDVLIQTDNVRNAEAQLRRAQGFYAAGTRARIEVTNAEAQLANARVLLVSAENSELNSRQALLGALGLNQAQQFLIVNTVLSAPAWDRDRTVSLARETRPDLQAAFARIRAAEARVRNARAAYYPTVNVNMRYAWSENYFPPQFYNWNVGLGVNFPILNEPLLSSGVQSAKAAMNQAEANEEILALTVQQEASTAWVDLQGARARLTAAEFGLKANEENYRLATERYRVGVGSSIEQSDAQRLLIQARSQELQARYDVQLAIARLYRRAGSLTLDSLLPLRSAQ